MGASGVLRRDINILLALLAENILRLFYKDYLIIVTAATTTIVFCIYITLSIVTDGYQPLKHAQCSTR